MIPLMMDLLPLLILWMKLSDKISWSYVMKMVMNKSIYVKLGLVI